MIRIAAALTLATALAACSPAPTPAPTASSRPAEPSLPVASPSAEPESPEEAAIKELAGIYEFTPDGEGVPACLLRLDAEDQGVSDQPVRLAWMEPRCWQPFPALRTLASWTNPGGGSIDFVDPEGKTIISFSPVQDGTGVYLRGGAGGKLFNIRQPTW